jgi:hypothetical protein
LVYFFAAFLLACFDEPFPVLAGPKPLTLLPASAAPLTAPSAAPLAAPTKTAFSASLALLRIPALDFLLPDVLLAPNFTDFFEAGFLVVVFEADLLDVF